MNAWVVKHFLPLVSCRYDSEDGASQPLVSKKYRIYMGMNGNECMGCKTFFAVSFMSIRLIISKISKK